MNWTSAAKAQPTPLDPAEFKVNSCASCTVYVSQVAGDFDDDFVVVWQSLGSTGSDSSSSSIQARRYTGGGLSLDSEQFQVNAFTTGPQNRPAVAREPGGGIAVAWESLFAAGSDPTASIQARLVPAAGAPEGPPQFQVNTCTTDDQARPALAFDAQANFVVVWESDGVCGGDDSGKVIQARRFAGDCTPLDAADFQVNTFEYGSQRSPAVAVAPDGEFMVVWESQASPGTDPSGWSLRARRFAPDGTPVDVADFQVNTYTIGHQLRPAVAADFAGRFVVAWDSYGSWADDQSYASIQVRRFGTAGPALDAQEFQVNTTTLESQYAPRVSAAPGGSFVVVWQSFVSSGGDDSYTSVQARRFDRDGQPVDAGDFQVNAYTTSWQTLSSVTARADGDFVVAWGSDGSFGGDDGRGSIEARRFGRPTIAVTSMSGGTGGPGCTLRDALTAANSGAATGDCPAGNEGAVIELPERAEIVLDEVDNGTNGLPQIEKPVTVRGRGSTLQRAGALPCPGVPEFRIWEVAPRGVLELEDLTVAGGCLGSAPGGALYANAATVITRGARIVGNRSWFGGGGVALQGSILLSSGSSFESNSAGDRGGGISVTSSGFARIEESALWGNVAAAGGGLAGSGAVIGSLRNSTISGNAAAGEGGAVELSGATELALEFATVTRNLASGGALTVQTPARLSLHDSIVGDPAGGVNCAAGAGTIAATGQNLDTDGTCAALAGGGITTVPSLSLAPLADNGGHAPSHLPNANSPAIDAAAACTTRSGAGLFRDQRGAIRPTDDDGDLVAECELGSVERGPVFADGVESGNTSRWSLAHP